MSIFQQTITILFFLFIALGIPVRGNCEETDPTDEITVQGAEIVIYISGQIDTCITELEKGDRATVRAMIEHTSNLWRSFTENEENIFKEEVEKSEQLETVITDISTGLTQVIDHLNNEKAAPVSVSPLLLELKQRMENLLPMTQQPVLIAFIGPRCTSWPDCRSGEIMNERVNDIALEFNKSVRVVFIDVKKNKEIARTYNILFVPTLVFIDRSGKERYRKVGEMDEISIKTMLFDLIKENE